MPSSGAKTVLVLGSLVGAGVGGLYLYDKYLKKTTTGGCTPGLCSVNCPCASGYICQSGTCIPTSGCTSDAMCPSGEYCADGVCESCNQLIPFELKTPSIISSSLFGGGSLLPGCSNTACGNPSCAGYFSGRLESIADGYAWPVSFKCGYFECDNLLDTLLNDPD